MNESIISKDPFNKYLHTTPGTVCASKVLAMNSLASLSTAAAAATAGDDQHLFNKNTGTWPKEK
jgi:hypothetical protein